MAVQTFQILSKANRSNQTYTSSTATIPANITAVNSVRYYVDSTNNQGVIQYTDPSTHINLQSQLSYDGGVTWQDDAGFQSDGGAHNRQGQAIDPEISTQYYPPLTPGVMVRGTIQVIGTVRFGVKVDVDYIP